MAASAILHRIPGEKKRTKNEMHPGLAACAGDGSSRGEATGTKGNSQDAAAPSILHCWLAKRAAFHMALPLSVNQWYDHWGHMKDRPFC